MRLLLSLTGMLAYSFLLSCNSDTPKTETVQTSFFDKSGMDTSSTPGNNFFQYANGSWMKNTPIPDDQSGTGSFFTLYENNIKQLKGILEETSKSDHKKGSLEQKVGDYFISGMDTIGIDKLGSTPLIPMLANIDAIKNSNDIVNLLAKLIKTEEDALLGVNVGGDDKNSAMNIVTLSQTGISLPERDYYFRKDSAAQAARAGLVKYATILFTLIGFDTSVAAKNAQNILALETAIASSHRTPVALRDPQINYNKMSIAQLEQLSPNIGWNKVLIGMNMKVDSIDVAQPDYFKALSILLKSQPIDVWKTKLKYDYINRNANLLSKNFVDAKFYFSKLFSGQKIQSDRWKTMVTSTDGNLGELLGQLYVKKYFTPDAKKRMDELVTNLQKSFEARINKLDWMSDSTKQKAQKKLNAFTKKIGYPSKWKNFDDVTIDKADFFANAMSVRSHRFNEMLAKVNKPVDRTEWGMTPPTVNAYYNPGNNEIVFPAGILQFPFFDMNADDAINYGGIGMVIGHEMTHGFDDQGSQYNDVGNLVNWWGKEDEAKFKAKTGNVVKQYNGYTVFDSVHVNGALTLGENLADIGGLTIAYDAFKLTKQGQGNEKIDGFTPDQRFFLGYAQVWRLKSREENMRARLNTDPHSPEAFRVNGPASNFSPFYTAFDVKQGDKMYKNPEERIKIW